MHLDSVIFFLFFKLKLKFERGSLETLADENTEKLCMRILLRIFRYFLLLHLFLF